MAGRVIGNAFCVWVHSIHFGLTQASADAAIERVSKTGFVGFESLQNLGYVPAGAAMLRLPLSRHFQHSFN